MYGCDHWEYGYGRASLGFSEKAKDPTTGLNDQSANCKFPERWGWIAAFYMVSFVVLGALVLLTLFIGIVATAMEEAKAGQQDDDAKEELLVARVTALGIEVPVQLDLYRALFNELDRKKEGVLSPEAMKPVLRALPLLHVAANAGLLFSRAENATDTGSRLDSTVIKEMNALKESASGSVVITRSDVDKLCSAMNTEYAGSVEFNEFLVIMEFLRRSGEAPEALLALRNSYADATDGEGGASSTRTSPQHTFEEEKEGGYAGGDGGGGGGGGSGRAGARMSRELRDIDVEELDPDQEIAELEDTIRKTRNAIFEKVLNDQKQNNSLLRRRFCVRLLTFSILNSLLSHQALKGMSPEKAASESSDEDIEARRRARSVCLQKELAALKSILSEAQL